MAEVSSAPAPPPVPADALRLVLFGMPAAGKTSLLAALSQVAQSQEHLLKGRLNDLSHRLAGLRQQLYEETGRRTAEEVVPYPVDFEPFGPAGQAQGEHQGVVLIDCDGRVANDLLLRRQALAEDSPEGTLAREVVRADALLLVIDASVPAAQVDADFGEFDRFLREMERSRGERTEVGGLPVFLVLTKCDLLAQPADSPADWMERIEERKREVDQRFRAFLAERGREEGSVPFGRIDLHVWATAVKRPALVGTLAKAREPFGVAELFRQCLEDAAAFRGRQRRAGRRLGWVVGGTAGVMALLAALTVGQYLRQDRPESPLQIRVENLRFADRPTPAERLRGPEEDLRRRRDQLAEVEKDPGFGALPADLQEFVRAREKELNEYLSYLRKVEQSRRPGDVQTVRALEALRGRLEKRLALPHPDWQDTDAGRLRQERLADADALLKAVARARNWYLDSIDRAGRLWTFAGYKGGADSPGIDWRTWAAQVEKLLGPGYRPPFTPQEPVPGSATLTYSAALDFDTVKEAQVEWEAERGRLKRVLDLSTALGLAEAAKERPAVLAIPRDFTLAQARERRRQLEQAYPNYQKGFVLDGLPDAIQPDVRQAARTNYGYLLPPAQDEVLRQLRQGGSGDRETPGRWEAVRRWLKDPEELAAWRVLARVLVRLHDPDAPEDDPVRALASFLGQERFTIEVNRLTLEVPERLKVRPAPDAVLAVHHGTGDRPALALGLSGEGQRDVQRRVWLYTFRPVEGQRLVYRPGDRLWATLALQDGWMFTWARSRSAVYQFERLRRPPRLHRATEPNTSGELEEGVRLLPDPPDGIPRVPDLLPLVRLER
jgi:hypothetical protein